jgi:hypothetical protein
MPDNAKNLGEAALRPERKCEKLANLRFAQNQCEGYEAPLHVRSGVIIRLSGRHFRKSVGINHKWRLIDTGDFSIGV